MVFIKNDRCRRDLRQAQDRPAMAKLFEILAFMSLEELRKQIDKIDSQLVQ